MSAAPKLESESHNLLELETAVETCRAEAAELKATYERVKKTEGEKALAGHNVSKQYPAAKARLAAAEKRLREFKQLDYASIEAEIAQLRAATAPEAVASRVPPIAAMLAEAARLRLEAFIAMSAAGKEVDALSSRALELERKLRPDREPDRRYRIAALAPLKGIMGPTRDDLIRLICELGEKPDGSVLSNAITRDGRNPNLFCVAGRDAGVAIDFALGID